MYTLTDDVPTSLFHTVDFICTRVSSPRCKSFPHKRGGAENSPFFPPMHYRLFPLSPGIYASGSSRARDGSTWAHICMCVYICMAKFDVRWSVLVLTECVHRAGHVCTYTRECMCVRIYRAYAFTARRCPTPCHVYVSKSIFGVTGLW